MKDSRERGREYRKKNHDEILLRQRMRNVKLRDETNAYHRQWHKNHPEKRAEYRRRRIEEERESVSNEERAKREYKSKNRWKQYGLTNEQFHELLTGQDDRCAICFRQITLDADAKLRPHVDHDHASGRVRGLLCGRCNVGLGMFGDDLEIIEQAQRYLRENG